MTISCGMYIISLIDKNDLYILMYLRVSLKINDLLKRPLQTMEGNEMINIGSSAPRRMKEGVICL